MEKEQLIRMIIGKEEIRPYHIPGSYELDGQSFVLELPGHETLSLRFRREELEFRGAMIPYQAVKCEDSVFFVCFDGMLLLLDAALSRAVLTDGKELWTNFTEKENPLFGWETPVRFGAYLTLDCRFDKDTVTIGEEAFSARYVQYAEKLCLVLLDTEEGGLVIALNLDRFLIYTGINGKILGGGFIKFPEEE